MQPIHVTQCPKCDTTFRVTQAQLTAAKGAVRCGACLHVFRAAEHFQESKPAPTPIADDRTQDLFSDKLFGNNADPLTHKDDFDHGLINDDLDDDNLLISDDSGLIDDDFDPQEKQAKAFDLDENFLSLKVSDDSDPFSNDKDRIIEDENSLEDDDESWAQALLDDDDFTGSNTAAVASSKPLPKVSARPVFSYIEDVPLDLSLPVKTSNKQKALVLSSTLVLLLTLAGQAAYFHFDNWARLEPYRAYYQIACDLMKCQLPSTYDLNKIRTTASPQVSLHSKYENALVVDVLFINNADFEQAFPKIDLTFTDKHDKVVAHRLFSPREYLAGEASGLEYMPSQTPIHIALEIADPGSHANNYRVEFRKP